MGDGKRVTSRRRLLFAYAFIAGCALLGIALIQGLGSKDASRSSHIDLSTGSTNGARPDEREGIPPPPPKTLSLRPAVKTAHCELKRYLPDEGHKHVPPDAATPRYHTNPPTSGTHAEPPYQQADGAYIEMPRPLFFVHSLEHGRLEIQYSPQLPENQQLELLGLYQTMWRGTLLFPNAKMPYAVAASTWTNLLGCRSFHGLVTLDAISAFGKATWGRFGENSALENLPPAPNPRVHPTGS
jgi:hypothetical protein